MDVAKKWVEDSQMLAMSVFAERSMRREPKDWKLQLFWATQLYNHRFLFENNVLQERAQCT